MDGRGIVELLQRDGHALRWEEPCPGGEFGASFVDAEGRPSVLKFWPHTQEGALGLERSVRRSERARLAGYPAPEVVAHGRVDAWLWHLQERVAGALVDEPLSQAHVDRLVDANKRAEGCGIGEGEPWGEELTRSLRTGLETWCIHAVVSGHSARASALLQRIVAVGNNLDAGAVPATDFAHMDFHHRNFLAADGRLTAIIDCDGSRDGDRRFDLVTLSYWLGFVGAEPGVADGLAQHAAAETPPELLVPYNAHMVLRNIDFYARTGRPDIADLHVAYGEAMLEQFGA